MYGYVRPFKDELKVKEYRLFRSAYCGLCHSLKERCGLPARFVVNYDFTFMAMLLSKAPCPETVKCRCAVSPIRGRSCHCKDAAMEAAADFSVILAYWKLRDSVEDDGFFGSLRERMAALALKGAYRKASANAPVFDVCTRSNLQKLSELEHTASSSIDAAADCFASILQAAAAGETDDTRRRILEQIFYHTGRIVYILDAVDDFDEDQKNGNYNVLRYRFNTGDGKLSEEMKAEIGSTLQISENMLISAFELLDEGIWTSILRNILFDGLPQVSRLVLCGKWREMQMKSKEKMNGVNL